ncbi:5-ht4 receptor [Plakobranchus ocellatus]|uniref:5-ht4 receptor n=1 Tax=Plakobranchus ocellatus TaxID=259542 RepID=A0AAV4DKJ7_9GAST|nr:5-ht4 receptor [Plakobranchus ocellatus]
MSSATSNAWLNGSATNGSYDPRESKEQATAWCNDLQGSDFVYTPTRYSTATRHFISLAFIFLIFITVIGNGIVIVTVVVDKPLRKMTRALVVSMAASDILVAMCGELQSVVTMLSEDAWVLSDILCEVFTSADLYFSLCGILHIVCLAGDRYLAICYPFRYVRMDRKYLTISIVTVWTVPIAFSFVPILSEWHRIGLEELYACLEGLEVHVCTMIPNKGFSTVSFIIMFAFPSLLMGFCYTQIYRTAMSHKERMSEMTLGSYSSDKMKEPLNYCKSAEKFTSNILSEVKPVDHNNYTDSNDKIFIESNGSKNSSKGPDPSLSVALVPKANLNMTLHSFEEEEFATTCSNFRKISTLSGSYPNVFVGRNNFTALNLNHWPSCPALKFAVVYDSSGKEPHKQTDSNQSLSFKDDLSAHKVTFRIDSSCTSPGIDKMSDPEESSAQVCFEFGIDETSSIHYFPTHSRHSPKADGLKAEDTIISWRRSTGEDGSHPAQLATKNRELLARIEKQRQKKTALYTKSHKHGFLGEDFRTARSISFIIACFAITWCPYWLTMLVMAYLGPGVVPDPLIGACIWLAYFGSALNPFVYYFFNQSVKKGMKKRFLKFTQRHRRNT